METKNSDGLMTELREMAGTPEGKTLNEQFVSLSSFTNVEIRAMRNKALDAKAAASIEFDLMGNDRFTTPEGVKKGRNLSLINDVLHRLEMEMADRLMLPVKDLIKPEPPPL